MSEFIAVEADTGALLLPRESADKRNWITPWLAVQCLSADRRAVSAAHSDISARIIIVPETGQGGDDRG